MYVKLKLLSLPATAEQQPHRSCNEGQGWAQGSFVEAEAEVEVEVEAEARQGSNVLSRGKARQGRGRELEAEARQTKFEARPRRGDPLRKTLLPLYV